jgi:hypothetical protein
MLATLTHFIILEFVRDFQFETDLVQAHGRSWKPTSKQKKLNLPRRYAVDPVQYVRVLNGGTAA